MQGRCDEGFQRRLRELAPQALGAVCRRFGDFAAAEDAVQEALIAAAAQWPVHGMPDNPRGWLIKVAARRMTDQARAESARRQREAIVVGLVSSEDQMALADDDDARSEDETLDLLFMCCHPSLSPSSAIALTLRAVGGLTTEEIARAFFVPEKTMGQRISRAKSTLKDAGVRPSRPTHEERSARLGSVMHVIYLVYSEGYTASSGPELHRVDLSNEAIRLARLLHAIVPTDAEAAGLLALMVLTDARRGARTGQGGEIVPLDEQDRTAWDKAAIAEGITLITGALSRGAVGPYQLQAAIAAVHDESASVEATDWPQILALYGLLGRMSDNPMVALNRAVATAMVHGPAAGLADLESAAHSPALRDHHRVDAVRAHLLERAGDRGAAARCYRLAAEKALSVPEKEYLLLRAAKAAEAAETK